MGGRAPIMEEEKSFSHTYPIDNRAIARSSSINRENTRSNNAPNPLTSSITRLRELGLKGGVYSSLDASHNRIQGLAQANIAPNPADVTNIDNAKIKAQKR